MNRLKIGDYVNIQDGSYCVKISSGFDNIMDFPSGKELEYYVFKILAIGKNFPTEYVPIAPSALNNLILQEVENGDIVFIADNQVNKVEVQFCPYCNKIIKKGKIK